MQYICKLHVLQVPTGIVFNETDLFFLFLRYYETHFVSIKKQKSYALSETESFTRRNYPIN